jgi:hypothetical protein
MFQCLWRDLRSASLTDYAILAALITVVVVVEVGGGILDSTHVGPPAAPAGLGLKRGAAGGGFCSVGCSVAVARASHVCERLDVRACRRPLAIGASGHVTRPPWGADFAEIGRKQWLDFFNA